MGAWMKAASAMAAVMILTGCNEEGAVEAAMAKYHHLRLVPPTTAFGPGSLVAKKNYNPWDFMSNSVELDDLCMRKYSIDKYPEPPRPSETETQELSRLVGGKFSLDAPAIRKIINIDLKGSAIDHAEVKVTDVQVLTYSLEDRENIRDLLEAKCRGIVNRQVKKRNAYQIRSAVLATIDVNFYYDVKASAEAKAEAVAKLGSLSVAIDDFAGGSLVHGRALVYGVDLEPIDQRL